MELKHNEKIWPWAFWVAKSAKLEGEWARAIATYFPDENPASFYWLSAQMLLRWKTVIINRIEQGEKLDPETEFDKLVEDNKVLAQGAIVAIMELIQSIGNGEGVPQKYKELLGAKN